jgi:hypothetical protein
MPFTVLSDACITMLARIYERHDGLVVRMRKRLPYGGKKARAARKRLRRSGDWLYADMAEERDRCIV